MGSDRLKTIKDLLDSQYSDKKQYHFKKRYNKTSQKSDIFDFFDLINNWQEVVGERLTQHTIPLKLHNKTLTILTDHPVYSQQLSFMEMQLIKKVEEHFPKIQGEIKRIYFKADNNHFKRTVENKVKKQITKVETEKKWHPQSPEYKKAVQQAEALLKDVKDEEIRNSLKSLYLQIK